MNLLYYVAQSIFVSLTERSLDIMKGTRVGVLSTLAQHALFVIMPLELRRSLVFDDIIRIFCL